MNQTYVKMKDNFFLVTNEKYHEQDLCLF